MVGGGGVSLPSSLLILSPMQESKSKWVPTNRYSNSLKKKENKYSHTQNTFLHRKLLEKKFLLQQFYI
jgi:hypothetical protein